MRILLVTQYFYPENFKSNDVAFELSKRGYEVDALVGIPNYPEGQYFKGYGLFKKRHEIINGVNIYRAFQIPRGKGGWRLPINYYSYVISACFWIIFYMSWRKYDCIIGHATSPIFQAYPAILLRKFRKIPFYNWVLDLWPPSIMNDPKNTISRLAYKAVEQQVRFIYKRSDKLLISSLLFEKHVLQYGGNLEQIEYFPNWSDDMVYKGDKPDSLVLPEGFTIMMAGNLGKSQDLESVSKLIIELKDVPELIWVFVGDGSQKGWLDEFIKDNKLETKCFAIGRKPYNDMPYYFSKADALLISLKANSDQLNSVVPARLISYMSAGKPILGMVGKGGAYLINEAQCGYSVGAGEFQNMSNVIRKILNDRKILLEMGLKGRYYFEKYFTKEKCISHLCDIIESNK